MQIILIFLSFGVKWESLIIQVRLAYDWESKIKQLVRKQLTLLWSRLKMEHRGQTLQLCCSKLLLNIHSSHLALWGQQQYQMDLQCLSNLFIPNAFATLFYIQRKMPALPVFQARQMEISLAQKPRSSGHNTLLDRMCPAIKVNFSSSYERKLGFWPQLHRTRLFWLKVKALWRRGWPPKEHHSKGWRQARESLNA